MGNPQSNQQPRQFSTNETISLQERLAYVLGALNERRDELAAVLPPDIKFEAFHATINQALRTNPELLDCTSRSLINACVKAAYDGLRVDGKEAAIVWEMATVRTQGQPDRKEKQARYMPMYQGLVQQVLRGKMVLSCEADVIYENDVYKIIGGTHKEIIHEPLTDIGAERGRMVAAYNVATLPSGHKVTHYMLAADIIDIQKESKSGWDAKGNCSKGVWKRWPKEQWKKTVLRQHRKTLPVGRDIVIRDMELVDEFPQFNRQPHPQLSGRPRPQRQSALEDNSGTSAGVPLDLNHGKEGVVVDAVHHEERASDPAASNEEREIKPVVDLPADPAEWDMWMSDVLAKVGKAMDADAVGDIWRAEQAIAEHAPEETRNQISSAMTDRIAAIATGEDAG